MRADLLLCVLLLALAGPLGCRHADPASEQSVDGGQPTSTRPPAYAVPNGSTTRNVVGPGGSSDPSTPSARLRDDDPSWMTDRDDPLDDGWDTEAFNRAAGAQLKKLAKLLQESAPIDRGQAEQLVADDFACCQLRPAALQVEFQDAALVVRRASDGVEPSVGSDQGEHHGPDGFTAAAGQLTEPLPGEKQFAFKLFRVEQDGATVVTQVYYAGSGYSMDAAVQQNATWICRWQPGSDGERPRLLSIQVDGYAEVATRDSRGRLLADCTEAVLGSDPCFSTQLVYGREHWLRRIQAALGAVSVGHNGLAVGDINGDGLEDVFLCQMAGLPNRLFAQNRDGTATDIAAEAGVDFLDNTRSVLILDLDNNGHQDLVVALSGSILVLQGDGGGQFEMVAKLDASSVYSLAAADYDLDGDLDLYACRYSVAELYQRTSGSSAIPIPYHDANNGAPNILFRNDGSWQFTDVTDDVGLDVNNRRFSFAATWEDYDNDGDLDLYVANDYGRNNLYRNDPPLLPLTKGGNEDDPTVPLHNTGERHFVDVAPEAGVEDIATGMSAAWADFNRDGWMDIYVGNMFSSAGNRVAYQRQFQQAAGETTKSEYQRLARGNTLFQNDGTGHFRDVSVEQQVTIGRWAWSSPFVDLNNDGWEDILVANGFVTNSSADDL